MPHKHSKVLVTGGSGFIGSHIVDELLSEKFAATILDNREPQEAEDRIQHETKDDFRFIRGDIRDHASVVRAVQDIDVVIHLAALISVPQSIDDPLLYNEVNINGTINLLKASMNANVKKFIYASSCAVYGSTQEVPIKENHTLRPNSPYGISKMAAESYVQLFNSLGLKTLCLRFFNVYGPRQTYNQYSGVISKFLNAAKKNEPLTIFGDGKQTRDFVHVRDVAKAHLLALNSDVAGEIFNIATGVATSINDLAEVLLEVVNKRSLRIIHEEPREGDIYQSYADISRAKERLGYSPKIALKNGLEELLPAC